MLQCKFASIVCTWICLAIYQQGKNIPSDWGSGGGPHGPTKVLWKDMEIQCNWTGGLSTSVFPLKMNFKYKWWLLSIGTVKNMPCRSMQALYICGSTLDKMCCRVSILNETFSVNLLKNDKSNISLEPVGCFGMTNIGLTKSPGSLEE